MRTYQTVCGVIAAAISFCLIAVGCSSPQTSIAPTARSGDTTCDGTIEGSSPTYITVWFHTGQPVQQLQQGIARPRPQTPAYPAISLAYATALSRISQGANVQQALNTAVGQIDANLAANRYYPPTSP
jgi:hypothetical protein